jgi:ABC-type uncharacterized transport system substrate-binding protein
VKKDRDRMVFLLISVPVSISVFLSAFCFQARAQQAKPLARIAYLGNERPPYGLREEEVFLQGLRDYGWIEGQKIIIERRYWENRRERLAELADELVRLKLDIIVTTTGRAAEAAKKATSSIPIVMTGSADAVDQGVVASLARPGGNVTGLTNISLRLTGKRLELLKETFPKILRVAVLRCPFTGSRATTTQWTEAEAVARTLGIQLQFLEVRVPEDIEGAFQAMARGRADALFVSECTRIPRAKTVEFAAKNRLPAIHTTSRSVEAGGLMSYGADPIDSYRRAATYVDKILKGAKPADLPVEQPKKFELVINLKTAKQIGLTIPPNVLARADKVIK